MVAAAGVDAANDMARTIVQGSTTTTNTLDVMINRFAGHSTTTGATTANRTNHYSDDGDNPSWIADDTGYTRIIGGLANSAAQYTSLAAQLQWQIRDLHGDIVATALAGVAGLSATYAYDEYGVIVSGTPGRYGYLGGEQRSADNAAGLITMGVRLFNPATARFLSVDPIYGGNANPYEYCNGDPVNCTDISGMILGLPKLTKIEKYRCKWHPWQCSVWASVSAWAATKANQSYPEGGRQNAFRHCIWSAVLSYRLGNFRAAQWNEAHEMGGYEHDNDVDRHNNHWGRGAGDWARIYYPHYWQRGSALAWICKRCKELLRDGYLDLTGGN